MSATDELRSMLDERGVEWRDLGCDDTSWKSKSGILCKALLRHDRESLYVRVYGVTPNQAVEHTLGRGECRIEYCHGSWYCTGCGDMVGTSDPDSELCVCGNAVEEWSYCPWCGAKVVK